MSRLCLILAAASAFLLPLSAGVAAPSSNPDQAFKEAREAFEKQDLTGAESRASDLLKDGHLSPRLFELMGHLRYRQGDLGRAALWYERASLFPPPAPELRQNIAHVRDRTGNVTFTANGLKDQFAAWLTRSDWLLFATITGWVCVFAFALSLLFVRPKSGLRPFLSFVGVLALAASGTALLGWHWHPSYEKISSLAIITAPNARAYTAATTTSGSVMSLPPGSHVLRLEDRGAWTYVEMPTLDRDDAPTTKRGWIQSETLTAFWPFEAGYLE